MSFPVVMVVVLVVCWLMFTHYRRKARCGYCGGEWSKHLVGCPYYGSGMRMPNQD